MIWDTLLCGILLYSSTTAVLTLLCVCIIQIASTTKNKRTSGEGLLHVRDLAADEHKVLAVVDGAGGDDVEGGTLGHGVGRLDAGGDTGELHEGQCGVDHHHTIRNHCW